MFQWLRVLSVLCLDPSNHVKVCHDSQCVSFNPGPVSTRDRRPGEHQPKFRFRASPASTEESLIVIRQVTQCPPVTSAHMYMGACAT